MIGSSRYAATADQVTTQSRPTLTAAIVPCRQRRRKKLVLSPLWAAASLSESSRSSNGLRSLDREWRHYSDLMIRKRAPPHTNIESQAGRESHSPRVEDLAKLATAQRGGKPPGENTVDFRDSGYLVPTPQHQCHNFRDSGYLVPTPQHQCHNISPGQQGRG